jgi:2-dehydro-3-deoxygluconokinase
LALSDALTLMHDLVTLGEVLLRLAVPSPARFETTRSLDVRIGGAEANVAAACARLGLKTAWISAVPANPWGDRVRRELSGHGIDCAYVHSLPQTRLGLYFLEYGVAPRPVTVLYDRRDSAFCHLTPDLINWETVRRARLAHITGITPALGLQARKLVDRLIEEAPAFSFDVNYRAALWGPPEARAFAESVLPRARYVFVGRAEAQTIFGLDGDPERVIDRLARHAPRATIALLQGSDGSTVLDDGRIWRPTIHHAVHMVDPIGAGDAYAAGYIWATLSGRPSQDAVNIAATAAALKCSTWGDVALISRDDIEDALAGGADVRR